VTDASGDQVGYTPEYLRKQIKELKDGLDDKNAPFGVDLLIPQIGGSARKVSPLSDLFIQLLDSDVPTLLLFQTNKDYTGGKLNELVDITIESGAKLFVCAIGVPPPNVVEKLHNAKIPIMNMIGHPKHVKKALEAGVDIICAQGGEGGGHTGGAPHLPGSPFCAFILTIDSTKATSLPRFLFLPSSTWSEARRAP
jgi:NAD(P)H-dependent flavin oxidoreductase YrpB (nitropropane dioxygenase family)